MTDNDLDRYMRRYYKSVYGVALCHCKNPSDADDIAQDVFLDLYTYRGSFTGDEHIKAWLLRCAVNKSIDLTRSHWYRFSEPLEKADGRPQSDDADDGGSGLLKTIMKLKRRIGTVMYLYYFEEYPVSEIAGMLGISEAAVRSRLFRGRKQLQKLLDSERN
ncbi:MAG: RNA polymerase sigma factor [Ruminiclostridium sp.]|nr:RNA polymerase sigma factor [Ruminiclostridium sp.]